VGVLTEDICRAWIKEYSKIIVSLLKDSKNILDVSTGDGLNIELILGALPNAYLVSIDEVKNNILEAEKRFHNYIESKRLKLMLMNLSKFEFPERSFDSVVSFGTLHRVKDIISTLSEIIRVTKENGVIILCDWSTSAAYLKCIEENPQKLANTMSIVFSEVGKMDYVMEFIAILAPVYIIVIRKKKQ